MVKLTAALESFKYLGKNPSRTYAWLAEKTMKILVLGDIHGAFPHDLNKLICDQHPDVVLQCGDFGFWGKICEHIEPSDTLVLFCDGNHDHHPTLITLRQQAGKLPQAHEICPGVFYQDRGSTFTLPDGRVVLFAGGAWTVDALERNAGVDWFPEEILTEEELSRFPDPATVSVDIVVSHTCPSRFHWQLPDPSNFEAYPDWIAAKFRDPSCLVLDQVLERYRPSQWLFGHYHEFHEGETEGCKWTGLACPEYQGGQGQNWIWLK